MKNSIEVVNEIKRLTNINLTVSERNPKIKTKSGKKMVFVSDNFSIFNQVKNQIERLFFIDKVLDNGGFGSVIILK